MTIRVKSDAGLVWAYKPSLRLPRTPEMAFVVRGRYHLAPGHPLSLSRSDEIPDDLIERTRKESVTAAGELEAASLALGQGSITGDRFEETDENRVGELLYPSDFADFKLKADVLVRGTCHPPRTTDTECEVGVEVGRWKKTLKVVGHRVWVDRAGGGKHTDPKPIGSIAVDYAHAYGGPGFGNNPAGKGHVERLEGDSDDLYQPPRSERSQVMPSQQLPNVLYADGATHKGGLPAGFGPLNPSWPFRAQKLGTKYDQEWLDTRAPYFAADMDGTYFNAAPPDQQLEELRGDEEVTFTNLNPRHRRFSVRLPALRVRVFVRDAAAQCREIPMRLDTLFADLDDERLYLTWRGVTPVREDDVSDVEYGLVVTEPLAEKPGSASVYVSELEAFAADPVGLKDAFPAGFMEFAERAEKRETASDEELEALLENPEGNSPPVAAMKNIFGPLAPPGLERLDQLDATWAKMTAQEGVDAAASKAKVGDQVKAASRGGGGGVGMRIPVRDGEKVVFPIGNLVRQQEKELLAAKKKLPEQAKAEGEAKIDAALEKLRRNPQVRATDPHYKPFSEDDPPPDEPGPKADLLGRDLSDLDLSGRDLSGADLQCAILSRTKLVGANLTGAKLGGARLNRADLSGADLTGVDLTSASLDRVVAKGANLSGTLLDLVRISNCDFSDASFVGSEGMLGSFGKSVLDRADFGEAKLKLTSFDTCELRATRFRGAKLEHVRFDDSEGKGIVLEGANLLGTSFHACQLPEAAATGVCGDGAVWFRTGLEKACFHRAQLLASHFLSVSALDADFSRAHLPNARFDRAILRNASFERANLLGADLRKAVLTKTSFRKASLHDAQLTDSSGVDVDVEGADLKGANTQRSKLVTTRGGGL